MCCFGTGFAGILRAMGLRRFFGPGSGHEGYRLDDRKTASYAYRCCRCQSIVGTLGYVSVNSLGFLVAIGKLKYIPDPWPKCSIAQISLPILAKDKRVVS